MYKMKDALTGISGIL